jgi:hypothetical protein
MPFCGYLFCSAAQLVRRAGGNEDVTHRRLRRLWERCLVARWAFPGFRTHCEFYYYLDNRQLELHPQMLEGIRAPGQPQNRSSSETLKHPMGWLR